MTEILSSSCLYENDDVQNVTVTSSTILMPGYKLAIFKAIR
jgi:hypothetical protein